MTGTPNVLHVSEGDAGARLDVFLAERLQLSRAQARRLLGRGAVRVAGRIAGESDKGSRVAGGTDVEVLPFSRPEDERARADADAPLVILAEGAGWVAVDKPAGAPVHPLAEDEGGTVLSALLSRRPEIHGVGEGGLRSGVVHRLDVDTSGALLFATEPETWERLRDAFRAHRVEKIYRALVHGALPPEGRAEVGLVMARHRPARVRVVSPDEHTRGARPGILSWRCLEMLGPATEIEVRLETGFLHQIRATFAHLGAPVVGDRTYGPADDGIGAPRQMLHALRVGVDEVFAESPLPDDFEQVRARLGA